MDPGANSVDLDARARPATRAAADEVHVWRVDLDPAPEVLTGLSALLAEDEVARMRRYHFERHRRRFCAGRGSLRVLLGRYVDGPPGGLRFRYGAHGKPELAAGSGAAGEVRFNVSHSADEALICVSLGRELGVDIERIRPAVDVATIARRFFSAVEVQRLMGLPGERRRQAFFDCWTRKESLVKALGGGLTLPLDGFDVAFGPGVEARLLRVAWDPGAVERWSMAALDVADGFRAAVTVEGRDYRLRYGDASSRDCSASSGTPD